MGCLQHIPEMIRQICRISETDHAAAAFGFAGVKKPIAYKYHTHLARNLQRYIEK